MSDPRDLGLAAMPNPSLLGLAVMAYPNNSQID